MDDLKRFIWALFIVSLAPSILSFHLFSQEESREFFPADNSDHSLTKGMYLSKWELGIALSCYEDPRAFIYLRFYEWNLFDAVEEGEHSRGKDRWPWEVSSDQQEATLNSELFHARIKVVADGAQIELAVSNVTNHDWPDMAAIIPCLSPEYSRYGLPQNPYFFDEQHERTYFLGIKGLELLKEREIHFNTAMKKQILEQSADGSGTFPGFSDKWPTSGRDAIEGLMLRESVDRTWVTGIAWDRFLSAQGHNPRKCMHLSVRIGPLKVGDSKKLYGKIYLFKGRKENCLRHFEKDFNKQIDL
jgi:hypothetical protein